jgi:mRNA-degrading endonuclease RelE of RelBE toxin-antitoxin system
MNKIDKFLARISGADRQKIILAIECIIGGDIKNLDIKKLKGVSNRYRVRVGIYRIQFEMEGKNIFIVSVNKRDDTTYTF